MPAAPSSLHQSCPSRPVVVLAILAGTLLGRFAAQGQPQRPFGPVPSPAQLAWHELELYGFLHFGINTFTDREWGFGDESPALFAPTDFDADQIAGAFAEAGFRGLILTAKHHDGFCLWPSATTRHTVAASPFRDGRGDIVRELSEAARRRGLRFGVYLSPWDRNHAAYGTPEYIDVYRAQLRELLTGYGELFEMWHDGANGGDGYYGGARATRTIDKRTYYDWPKTWNLVHALQPKAVIFSDVGPGVRWVGNEKGIAGDPCWATISTDGWAPGDAPSEELNRGQRRGAQWLPAECDVSIRPGWFFHASENDRVRSPENLLDLYFQSVGRGASFLLNVPPDRRGRIADQDLRALTGFRELRDRVFAQDLAPSASLSSEEAKPSAMSESPPSTAPETPASVAFTSGALGALVDRDEKTYWSPSAASEEASVTLTWESAVTFEVLSLREFLPLGQRIDAVSVEVDRDGRFEVLATVTSIGARRLIKVPKINSTRLRLRFTSPVPPALSSLQVFAAP